MHASQNNLLLFPYTTFREVGRNSDSLRVDGPGIESGGGGAARFSVPFQTKPGAHPASYTMGTVSRLRG